MKTSVPLLIASDSTDDLREVTHHLGSLFAVYEMTMKVTHGGHFVVEHNPCVIVLSFQTPEIAHEFYTDILKHAMTIEPMRHRTVLLCAASDIQKACNAAFRGRFDEFIDFKPLLDSSVLQFRVFRQAQFLEVEARNEQSLGEQHVRESRRIADDAFARIQQGQRQMRDGTNAEQLQLRARLEQRLRGFESRLKGTEMADTIKVLDSERLTRRFDDLVSKDMGSELERFRKGLETVVDDLTDRYHRAIEDTHAALDDLAPEDTAPLSALVVDDEPEVNDMLMDMLELDGWQVDQAFDGYTGFTKAVSQPPNLILVDINLPKMNGIDLAIKLRTEVKTQHIPIIIITGDATRSMVEAARRADIHEFLAKPFDYSTLQKKVTNIMANMR